MKKILIIGATGFIGKKVADYLSQRNDIEVVRYARLPRQGYFCCVPGDTVWQTLIDDCAAIINCSGVGLTKIKKQSVANEAIARQLMESLPGVEGKKYRLLHLSTIKAFNANNYIDAYSADKQCAEKVFFEHSDKLSGELLRIPAVFGEDDVNIAPLLNMAIKGKLPEIKGKICRWYCISNQDVARYISCWLDRENEHTLKVSYLLSQRRYSVNDLIRVVNQHVHGEKYQPTIRRLVFVKLIYKILGAKSLISSGFRWNQFPAERFQDLFHRDWKIEVSENIAIHSVDFSLADIWKVK
ncbi:NAD-dependent epimerase/dehydratase family protein [Enterobacter dykesii]|nr:NAD(P)-dependent oxidoreductase [Escherichia coli]